MRKDLNILKRRIAIFLSVCMIMCSIIPTYADVDTGIHESDILTEDAGYVSGSVIVCVEGGEAALNREFSGGSGQKKMLRASREFAVDEVLASFEEEQQNEPETDAGQDAEKETEQIADERPRLFGAFSNAAAPSENTEEILLLHTDDVESLIEKLQKLSCVKYAQPDYILEIESYTAGTGEPYYYAQNHLENKDGGYDIDAAEAWQEIAAPGSNPQVVAVMDTGVNYTHPDLEDVMWDEGRNYPELIAMGGGDYGINTSGNGATGDPDDRTVGHGTHCASIIAGTWNEMGTAGVDANLRIMACGWMDTLSRTSSYIKAADYVLKAKSLGVNITVVNNSWGSGTKFFYQTPAINDMIGRMGNAGIVNVFAAGNESKNIDNYPQNTNLISDMTMQVGAVDSMGDLAVFSNYGEHSVDVMAPGVHILAAASLEDGVMSVPPQYCPWLAGSSDILYCDMEDEEAICVKAGPSETVLSLNAAVPELKSSAAAFAEEKSVVKKATPGETDDKVESEEVSVDEATPGETEEDEIPPDGEVEDDISQKPAIKSGKTVKILKKQLTMSGALLQEKATPSELASPSITTKQMYGNAHNHVLTFEQKYVKGKPRSFDIELQLTDDQAGELKEIIGQKKKVYIAFQIARDGGNVGPENSVMSLMIWNGKDAKFDDSGIYQSTFIDPLWNCVSFSIDTGICPGILDANNRIRMHFSDIAIAHTDTTADIYIDNIGIGTEPSEYTYSSGTSMACPVAVGVLAMIIDKLKAEGTTGKTDTEIAKEAMAYLKGGTVQRESISDKCINGGIINAANSIIKQNLHPVVNKLEDQGNGTSVINGYFFGNDRGAGSVSVGGIKAEVLSWSDNEIIIRNVSTGRSFAEVKVTSSSGGYGRIYAVLGVDDREHKYEELAPLPVHASEVKLCGAGNTILCFADEGVDPDEKITTVWKYDTIRNTWNRITLPGDDITLQFGVQYEITLAAGETEIYALVSLYPDETMEYSIGRLLTYDTLTDTWKYDVKVNIPSAATGALCVYNGELVLAGVSEEHPISRKIYPDTGEVYDTFAGVPQLYSGGYAFQTGDNILTAGMVNGVYSLILDSLVPGLGKFTENLIYDSKEENWRESSSVFFGEDSDLIDANTWRQSSAVPLKDGLMIVGPVRDNGGSDMTDTWIYRASTDSYEAYPALFETMRTKNVSSCLLGGRMYVMGTSIYDEYKGTIRLAVLDISEIAADVYPDVKKAPVKPAPIKPDPIRRGSSGSNHTSSLWGGTPLRTGTPDNPVSNGKWQILDDTWYYCTNAYFRNTWGYIVNPFATKGQHTADWFWFDETGRMLTGWQFINGKWYYLNPSHDGTYGACLIGPGKTPDGYEIDETGAWVDRVSSDRSAADA